MKKRILKLVLVVILAVFFTVPMMGCEANRNFTNEEHIARISERVRERFFSEGSEFYGLYEDFTVTILYDIWAQPTMFMVEFEPDGFFYGSIQRNRYYMCRRTNFFGGSRYIDHLGRQGGWTWRDASADQYFKSHFYVFGKMNERKFLLGGGKSPMMRPVYLSDDENGVLSCLSGEEVFRIRSDRPPIDSRGRRDNRL